MTVIRSTQEVIKQQNPKTSGWDICCLESSLADYPWMFTWAQEHEEL